MIPTPLPNALFTSEGRLQPAAQELLQAAWGHPLAELAETRWLPASQLPPLHAVLKVQGFVAITLGPYIYYIEEHARTLRFEDWFELLVHEQVHRRQIGRHGTAGFYLRYGWLALRHGYRQHPDEVEARSTEARNLLLFTDEKGTTVGHLLLGTETRAADEQNRIAKLRNTGKAWRASRVRA